MWNSDVARRPNFRDVPQQEREARLKLARETTNNKKINIFIIITCMFLLPYWLQSKIC
jgi:hypothetical protein